MPASLVVRHQRARGFSTSTTSPGFFIVVTWPVRGRHLYIRSIPPGTSSTNFGHQDWVSRGLMQSLVRVSRLESPLLAPGSSGCGAIKVRYLSLGVLVTFSARSTKGIVPTAAPGAPCSMCFGRHIRAGVFRPCGSPDSIYGQAYRECGGVGAGYLSGSIGSCDGSGVRGFESAAVRVTCEDRCLPSRPLVCAAGCLSHRAERTNLRPVRMVRVEASKVLNSTYKHMHRPSIVMAFRYSVLLAHRHSQTLPALFSWSFSETTYNKRTPQLEVLPTRSEGGELKMFII